MPNWNNRSVYSYKISPSFLFWFVCLLLLLFFFFFFYFFYWWQICLLYNHVSNWSIIWCSNHCVQSGCISHRVNNQAAVCLEIQVLWISSLDKIAVILSVASPVMDMICIKSGKYILTARQDQCSLLCYKSM